MIVAAHLRARCVMSAVLAAHQDMEKVRTPSSVLKSPGRAGASSEGRFLYSEKLRRIS